MNFVCWLETKHVDNATIEKFPKSKEIIFSIKWSFGKHMHKKWFYVCVDTRAAATAITLKILSVFTLPDTHTHKIFMIHWKIKRIQFDGRTQNLEKFFFSANCSFHSFTYFILFIFSHLQYNHNWKKNQLAMKTIRISRFWYKKIKQNLIVVEWTNLLLIWKPNGNGFILFSLLFFWFFFTDFSRFVWNGKSIDYCDM